MNCDRCGDSLTSETFYFRAGPTHSERLCIADAILATLNDAADAGRVFDVSDILRGMIRESHDLELTARGLRFLTTLAPEQNDFQLESEAAVRRLIALGARLPIDSVIPSHSDPVPDGPYSTFLLIRQVSRGVPGERREVVGDSVRVTTIHSIEATYSIPIFQRGRDATGGGMAKVVESRAWQICRSEQRA